MWKIKAPTGSARPCRLPSHAHASSTNAPVSARAARSAARRGTSTVTRAVAEMEAPSRSDAPSADADFLDPARPVRVLIAGGGIAGLVLAVALVKKGVDVKVFEQDMTAIRGEGKYRGPIQVQSNALAALEAIDPEMAAEVMAQGCITGDRINGLCDGLTGDWYVKFDTYHPAVNNGLPVTRVISRITLQQILAKYAMAVAGEDMIQPDSKVVAFEEDQVEGHDRAWAVTSDGQRYWGDVLIGADGIWSKVRTQLVGKSDPTYSGYTCYTGISDFVCPDIDTVAYRVFLGNGQYFVSSDVGGGKMQWYAFHEEDAGGKDEPGSQKARLMQIFGHWNDMVTDLIAATPVGDVLRRDIYDRAPIFKWAKGRVALLGDSAHAMQPNLGQGGCMAIEDAYELAKIISGEMDRRGGAPSALELPYASLLKRYQNERVMRAGAIHGMARMAAIAASTYKAYLGEQFHFEDKIKIPHPGRVVGGVAMRASMPMVLGWVLGGNTGKIKVEDRAQYCKIDDVPHGFSEKDWGRLIADDEELLKASQATWVLVPHTTGSEVEGAVALEDRLTIGAEDKSDINIACDTVSAKHARVTVEDGKYYVTDRSSSNGSWLNGKKLQANKRTQLHPGDFVEFGAHGNEGVTYKVKQMHRSQKDQGLLASNKDGSSRRYDVAYPHHVSYDTSDDEGSA